MLAHPGDSHDRGGFDIRLLLKGRLFQCVHHLLCGNGIGEIRKGEAISNPLVSQFYPQTDVLVDLLSQLCPTESAIVGEINLLSPVGKDLIPAVQFLRHFLTSAIVWAAPPDLD